MERLPKMFSAAFTPSTADGEPGLEAFRAFLAHQAGREWTPPYSDALPLFDGFVIFGTTGGNFEYTLAQGENILEAAGELRQSGAMAQKELVAGIGWDSLDGARRLLSTAEKMGYDSVIIRPPRYAQAGADTPDGFRTYPGDGAVFEGYYRPLIEASSLGVYLYNIPQRTGLDLQPGVISMIGEDASLRPKVIGAKDSSDEYPERSMMYEKRFPWLNVYVGNDRHILYGMGNGAKGLTSGMSNGFGNLIRRLTYAASNRLPSAGQLQREVDEAIRVTRPHEVSALLGLWGFGSQGGKVPFDDVQMWSFIVKVAGCDNPVSELLINELVSSTPNDVRFKTDWIDRLKGCGPKMLEPMPNDPGTGQGDANGRLMKS